MHCKNYKEVLFIDISQKTQVNKEAEYIPKLLGYAGFSWNYKRL